ncbi:MAG TPA: WG repeat-containing protein [Candidatus Obscuribacter sp.]|nr:WG repeat-containing protein [Candidatus Obscuribacter sp.]MBK9276812.1 WG repeat-containing protein [Candidatus Obscuribacter sp.]MBL8083301.1 WG repeat-containing protein [Candidatus Obscuribacter sp.]HMW90804.1 WG repeat-containing protein [Candidatus Obscuribacter sp.]HMX45444.1 WG repeat-containing protein [Candidatus Obscuribacter sp.]
MKAAPLLLSALMVLSLSGCAKKQAPTAYGRWGYLDKTGKFLILPQFDGAAEVTDNGAVVLQNKHLMRLDPETLKESSTPIGPDDKAELPPLTELRFAEAGTDTYKIKDGETVIFDPTEKKKELPSVFPKNGQACARFGDKFAFITPEGKLGAGIFDEARPFHEGRAAVKQAGKWGYIKKDGSFIIPPQYLEAGSFNHGLAPVKQQQDPPN